MLDKLVKEYTSFHSWFQLELELKRGYVPKIDNDELKNIIQSLGYVVR